MCVECPLPRTRGILVLRFLLNTMLGESMRVKHTLLRGIVPQRLAREGIPLLVAISLGAVACTEPQSPLIEFEPYAEAVLRFEQPNTSALRSFRPNDLKAESTDAAWIADLLTGAVLRFEPLQGHYRRMGMQDEPPAEIDTPVKIAVSKDLGVFVFDLGSNKVHLFSPGGEHLRAFEPGFLPSRIEITRSPIGLVFGLIDTLNEGSPRLTVIRTDAVGGRPDTLLQRGSHGPAALWEVVASPGELSLDGGESGMWAWAKTVPDTVFEITDSPQARKRILRPEDRAAQGVLIDIERGILWVVRAGDEDAELRFSAYDATEPGTVEAQNAFLGERSTVGFWPWDAVDGTIMGLRSAKAGGYNLASYDMLLPPALP